MALTFNYIVILFGSSNPPRIKKKKKKKCKGETPHAFFCLQNLLLSMSVVFNYRQNSAAPKFQACCEPYTPWIISSA